MLKTEEMDKNSRQQKGVQWQRRRKGSGTRKLKETAALDRRSVAHIHQTLLIPVLCGMQKNFLYRNGLIERGMSFFMHFQDCTLIPKVNSLTTVCLIICHTTTEPLTMQNIKHTVKHILGIKNTQTLLFLVVSSSARLSFPEQKHLRLPVETDKPFVSLNT